MTPFPRKPMSPAIAKKKKKYHGINLSYIRLFIIIKSVIEYNFM